MNPWDEDANLHYIHEALRRLSELPELEPDEEGSLILPVLPFRGLVLLPGMWRLIKVGRPFSVLALEAAWASHRTLIALIQRDPEVENPGPEDFEPYGVEIVVSEPLDDPEDEEEGVYSILVQARRRVQVLEWLQTEPFFIVRAQVLAPIQPDPTSPEVQALRHQILKLFQQILQAHPQAPAQQLAEAERYLRQLEDLDAFTDMIASGLRLSTEDALILLRTVDVVERMRHLVQLLAHELAVRQLEQEIQERVQEEINRFQRETYLREQMKAIQNELGEGDLWHREIRDLRERIEKKGLPEEARRVALRELERLSQLPPMSPEVSVLRNYLDWILDLPWNEETPDNLDLRHAAKVLDENHYGLKRAKERILEYIAVLSLRPKHKRPPILCFVGPPGTGKTSMGRSIAQALGRKFVRISLGGVRDEAEIRGHRRTYVGALPGRILQTLKRAGTVNPVFMLDEIDKLGADYRGDPAAALLEVLDPEQNAEFSDHYLEIPYDLSRVLFITTANTLYTIPPALLDRMEVIEFPGYVEEEKLAIARRYLIPRQIEESGLAAQEIRFTEAAIRRIIREYTYEAGVRNLERTIGRICRRIARLKAEGKRYPTRITEQLVERLLGPPEYFFNKAEKTDEVGVAIALAWTENGGDIMPVEVLLMEGKGNLQITGQIGSVMQESVYAALSYVRAHSRELGIAAHVYDKIDIHVHIPEGAVPKDGPSAGVPIAVALASAFTGRPVRHEVGMTGEITLRGKVLPVGGIREKVLAAHRAGLRTVLLPERNLKDLQDVPRSVRESLQVIGVKHLDQVFELALREPKPDTSPPRAADERDEEEA
ncbi:MAG: endopeptidase La [Chloroflexi bacterium]|nr:endopeptidase La [Chloroflexota bacterium]